MDAINSFSIQILIYEGGVNDFWFHCSNPPITQLYNSFLDDTYLQKKNSLIFNFLRTYSMTDTTNRQQTPTY